MHLIGESRSRAQRKRRHSDRLQIDCEDANSRFQVRNHAAERMKFVSQIMIEYHWKFQTRLLEFLRSLALSCTTRGREEWAGSAPENSQRQPGSTSG